MRYVSEPTLGFYQYRYGTTNSHRSGRDFGIALSYSFITEKFGTVTHPCFHRTF